MNEETSVCKSDLLKETSTTEQSLTQTRQRRSAECNWSGQKRKISPGSDCKRDSSTPQDSCLAERKKRKKGDSAQGYVARRFVERREKGRCVQQMIAAILALFERYRQERQQAQATRLHGLGTLRKDGQAFDAELTNWAKTQHMFLKAADSKGGGRREMTALIRKRVNAAREKHRQQFRQRREGLIKQTTLPCWSVWLTQQAGRGDIDALTTLRDRAAKAQCSQGDLLTAKRAENARTVILNALKPQACKDGAMIYHTLDGGMVIDRSQHVQAKTFTTGAALVALELASQKFDGQPLIVEGSSAFGSQVAQLAGLHNIKVIFTDPALELRRQESARIWNGSAENTRQPHGAPTGPDRIRQSEMGWPGEVARGGAGSGEAMSVPQSRAPEEKNASMPSGRLLNWLGHIGERLPSSVLPLSSVSSQAGSDGSVIGQWIGSRNQARESVSSLEPHRLWQPSDAGSAIYQGRLHMTDGSEVLLLRREGEILVKPSTTHMVAKASKWKIGRSVHVSRHGRFVGKGAI